MPLSAAVDQLSDDSPSAAPPEQSDGAPKAPRKRKRSVGDRDAEKLKKSSEEYLRSLLGRRCSCKKANCFQQFTEPETFSKLQDYRRHWLSLHKLDQDAFVIWQI